ncbi:MAG: Flp pilus assembly complex ATPase component TadA [Burkholderiaceae bacterium]|nr:Flp pilus assembly complex ATPase component TadA [Burkholderiaceae bacterium]
MITLIVEAEGEAPRALRLGRFPCRIGRQADSDVRLAGWRVARLHAEIHRIEHGFKLVDRGSLGGTWVNGERIVEYAPLDDDDEIAIAGYRLRVHPRADGQPYAAAADAADDIGAAWHRRPANDGRAHAPWEALAPGAGRAVHGDLEWRRLLHRRLLAAIDLRRQDIRQLSAGQLRQQVEQLLRELLEREGALPPELDRERLVEQVLDEAVGLGPLEPLLRDDTITEIMVNTPDEVYVERDGRLERAAAAFTGEDAVRATIDRIVTPVGRRVDEGSPMVDARLPDGSRVNAVIAPVALRGPAITIRRFNHRLYGPQDLVEIGSLSQPMLDFLAVCVHTRRNIVVSGGTGSGKTTLLNLLSNLIPANERVVTIEDAAELRLAHAHRVSLEARPANAEGRGQVTIRDLVRNALRMRPDRIVVGECRGGEAIDMLQAMNTGHDGSLTTVHANSPRDVVSRLETMVLMADVEMPVLAIREQIAAAIDVVVQQARMGDGRRRVVEIVEFTGLEGPRVLTQPLFRFDRRASTGVAGGRFVGCNNVPQFYEALRDEGLELDLSVFREAT